MDIRIGKKKKYIISDSDTEMEPEMEPETKDKSDDESEDEKESEEENNDELIRNLEILKEICTKKRDVWRERAYVSAIASLKAYPKKIRSISELRKHKLPGVGEKTLQKIDEFLELGYIPEAREAEDEIKFLEEEEGDEEKILKLFRKVWGIGPKKAQDLYEMGYKTIKELRKANKKDPELFNRTQKIGLEYFEDLEKRLPRKFIRQFEKKLKKIISKHYGDKLSLEITGSYRRGNATSGDVDCLITFEEGAEVDLSDIVDLLTRKGIILEKVSMRGEKFSGIAEFKPRELSEARGGEGGARESEEFHPFHFDIEFLPKSVRASAILYFTGSQATNIRMRNKAKRLGYKLNEHGIFKITRGKEKLIPTETEEEIFEILGMDYIEPTRR